MTTRRLFVASVAICSVLLVGCGSTLYLNKDYPFTPMKSVSFAITPIGSQPNLTDTAFAKIFVDTLGYQKLLPPSQVRSILFSDSGLVTAVNAIMSHDYSSAQLNDNPGLGSILSEVQIRSLAAALAPSEVLLVPVQFSVSSSVIGHTFGFYKFRLYDLRTGALIYQKSMDLNVNIPGQAGERHLTIVLIAFAADDFDNNYLFKVKK